MHGGLHFCELVSEAQVPVRKAPDRSLLGTLGLQTVLVLGTCLACLVILEVGLRIQGGRFFGWHNPAIARGGPVEKPFFDPDPSLGWVPHPGASMRGADLRWDATVIPGTQEEAVVSADAEGLRVNGLGAPPPDEPTILAVGDSFTLGSHVSDHQTRPAALEQELAVRDELLDELRALGYVE